MSTEFYVASRNDRLALVDIVERSQAFGADAESGNILPRHHLPVTVVLNTQAAAGDILAINNHVILNPTYDYDNDLPRPERLLKRYMEDPVFSTTTIRPDENQRRKVILLEDGDQGDYVQGVFLGLASTRLLIPEDAEDEQVYRKASIIDEEQRYLKADPDGLITVWHHKLGEPEQIVPCWVLLDEGSDTSVQTAIGQITTSGMTLETLPGPSTVRWRQYKLSEDAQDALDDEEVRAVDPVISSGDELWAINPREVYLRPATIYMFIKFAGVWYVDNQLSFIEYQTS